MTSGTDPLASPIQSADLRRDIAGATDAHARLVESVSGLSDDDLRMASLLPGWTIGHVLAHVARNADSHVRMLDFGERGDVADQYEGGAAGRQAEIERDALADAAWLIADLRRANRSLEQRWSTMSAAGWAGEGRSLLGQVPLSDLPFRRWRETEVHHVDLGLAYVAESWPGAYVKLELTRLEQQWAARRPMGLTRLPDEALAAPPAHRLAWLLGRREIEGLGPAGIF